MAFSKNMYYMLKCDLYMITIHLEVTFVQLLNCYVAFFVILYV